MFMLGRCLEAGDGVAENAEDAKVWFAKSAAQGHDDAQEQLDELNRMEEELD
jgi:TPR repeat protein